MVWIYLAQYKDKGSVVVNTKNELSVSIKFGEFIAQLRIFQLLKWSMLYVVG